VSNTPIAKSLLQASPTAVPLTPRNAKTTTSSAAEIQALPVLKLSLPFLVLRTSIHAVSSVTPTMIALRSRTRIPPAPCGDISMGLSEPLHRIRSSGFALSLPAPTSRFVETYLEVSSLLLLRSKGQSHSCKTYQISDIVCTLHKTLSPITIRLFIVIYALVAISMFSFKLYVLNECRRAQS
jgi:hypothetical protein